jgi:hypothetical protein
MAGVAYRDFGSKRWQCRGSPALADSQAASAPLGNTGWKKFSIHRLAPQRPLQALLPKFWASFAEAINHAGSRLPSPCASTALSTDFVDKAKAGKPLRGILLHQRMPACKCMALPLFRHGIPKGHP